jgi:cytochrome c oxidase subunit 2
MIEYLIPQASSYASDIDNLFMLVVWIVGFWFFATVGMFLWLVFRFRAKEGVPAQYVTGKEPHLKKWVTIPHALIIVCDVFLIVGAVQVWYHVKQQMPEAEQTIRVTGQQWAWTFVHPGKDGEIDTADDITRIDELHLRNNTVYHFILESQDVNHSFSIPVFRLKQDALPGRVITGWFEPTRVGEYDIQCAEMCGPGHGIMGAKLYVETEEAHDAWMANATNAQFAIK